MDIFMDQLNCLRSQPMPEQSSGIYYRPHGFINLDNPVVILLIFSQHWIG